MFFLLVLLQHLFYMCLNVALHGKCSPFFLVCNVLETNTVFTSFVSQVLAFARLRGKNPS